MNVYYCIISYFKPQTCSICPFLPATNACRIPRTSSSLGICKRYPLGRQIKYRYVLLCAVYFYEIKIGAYPLKTFYMNPATRVYAALFVRYPEFPFKQLFLYKLYYFCLPNIFLLGLPVVVSASFLFNFFFIFGLRQICKIAQWYFPSGFANLDTLSFRQLCLWADRVVLWLTLLVDSLEVTDLISDVADNCLDRKYAHNMLTTAHAVRGRLNDDDQFRNGLVRDLVF